MADLSEKRETLWILAFSPTIWAAHFLLSYITAAIWCAKVVGRAGGLGEAKMLIGVYTVAALAGIAAAGWSGFKRHTYGTAAVPHDYDTPEDRHRFLGFATLLLSVLSAVATIYVALAAVFADTCF